MGTVLIAAIAGFIAYPVLVKVVCPVLFASLKRTSKKWQSKPPCLSGFKSRRAYFILEYGMNIFISSKDNKRLPKLDFDVFCSCSKRIGAAVADYGNFLKITIHPCKECDGEHEPYKNVEVFKMNPNTGKTDFEITEECKKEWDAEDAEDAENKDGQIHKQRRRIILDKIPHLSPWNSAGY